MTVLLAAVLAGAAAAALRALPSPGRMRLAALGPRSGGPGAGAAPRGLGVLLGVPVLLLAGPVAALLTVAGALVAGHWSAGRRRSAAAAAERNGIVQSCRVLAAELSAGRSPAEALAAAAEPAVGPTAAALRTAAAAARLGGDVPAALTSGAAGSAVAPLLRALAACWTVCATSGSGLAGAVQRLEEGLVAEQDARRALDAELAGPRATAVLLAVLPAAGLGMAAGLGADPMHVLLHSRVGLVCLTLGLLLDGLGLFWTQRLVARVRPP